MHHLDAFLEEQRVHMDNFERHKYGLREAWLARLGQLCSDPECVAEAIGPDAISESGWRERWNVVCNVIGGELYNVITCSFPADTRRQRAYHKLSIGATISAIAIPYLEKECERYALEHYQEYEECKQFIPDVDRLR